MLTAILAAYGLQSHECKITPFGTGLINHTWKIENGSDEYILQRINQNVFKEPPAIAENMRAMGKYLSTRFPQYLFVLPVTTTTNDELVHEDGGYYRLMPFIKNSITYDVASSTEIACEAAREFGCFTKTLAGFDAGRLMITLPDFHNLTLRYKQFENSLKNGNAERIAESAEEIRLVQQHRDIVTVYERIIHDNNFRKRVTHHDTKISNVLFDKNNEGLCVIDLDTTMSGYFISDVGDMMRTYLCPYSEEEKDLSKVQVREEYFTAIAQGYLSEMSDELTATEIDHFVYAGEFMIYMQAVRFLTDYFNNDIYYGSKYQGHNLVRTKNQIELLKKYLAKSGIFRKQVMMLAGSPVRQN